MSFRKLIFTAALLFTVPMALAQTPQNNDNKIAAYFSETGAFQVKMPSNVVTQTHEMRIRSDMVAKSENVSATIDQRPFRNSIKKYIVQSEQTLGPDLTEKDFNRLIDLELDKYIAYYSSKNAALKNKEKKYFNGVPGGEIFMTYDDEEMGPQALRARLLYTNRTKVLQIVTSSEAAAFSVRSQEFFQSLSVRGGSSKEDGSIIEDWKEYTSPLKIFSILLPPPAKPYITKEPNFEHENNRESLTYAVYDPLRNEKINYKISAYQTGNIVTPKSAQYLMLKQHIAKYLNSPKGIEFAHSKNRDGFPTLSTSFVIKDPNEPSGLSAIRLRAVFAKDYIMVQELTTSKALMQSRFVTNLLGHALFHPQDAYEALQQEQKPAPEKDAEMGPPKPKSTKQEETDTAN